MKTDRDRGRALRERPPTYRVPAMKRLTIDVPVDLHSAIKVSCAKRGVKMADAIREILKDKFGGSRRRT